MAGVIPKQLRCEYRKNPLGIDVLQPRLSWTLEAEDDASRGQSQKAYQVLVASSPGLLEANQGDLWDSGKVDSDESIHVVYSGTPLCSRQRCFWKVRVWDVSSKVSSWSEMASWTMGLLNENEWQAKWIGEPLTTSWNETKSPPSPMLRKSFNIGGAVKNASVYVTALGLYELRINGRHVGDHMLAPEWTNYYKKVQYQTHDVTDLVQPGENAIGAILAQGWYAGRIGLNKYIPGGGIRGNYGRHLRLFLQLEIALEDGSTQIIVSDCSWRYTTDGPIRAADLFDGEIYDARCEMPGWDEPDFDDSNWKPVDLAMTGAPLVAQPNEPIKITQQIKPIALTEPKPGVYIFDFGQNMVGWCRLKVHGPAGIKVTLRHSEVLNPDGTIYRDNLRVNPSDKLHPGAEQEDCFILKGEGEEFFESHFTYHGFRYVEITGLPYKPSLDALTGKVLHSAAPETGSFECSSPMLNKLMECIKWTQRGNMHSIPTDCPQRDERLGWLGDFQCFSRTACFNMDMAAFLTKWVSDIRDAQGKDGQYPDFAPHPYNPNLRKTSTPGWGDAGVIVPWLAYTIYGDRRMLKEHFESAKRWIDYIHKHNPDLIWRNNRGSDVGDHLNGDTILLEGWPNTGGAVPKEVLATAYFAYSTELLSKMAEVIGREGDKSRYAELASDIRSAFTQEFVSPDGRIKGDTQAGYALALHFDLLPKKLRTLAARHMVEAIEEYNGHLSTGIQTTGRLLLELFRYGFYQKAYSLLNQREISSWGYMIEQGATTIWERWDGYVEGRGFQNPVMNSFNHYAFGSVGELMYRVIGGINPDPQYPAYKHILIRPIPGGELTWAKVSYNSIRGEIATAWELCEDGLTLDVSIPANTTASVYVPARDLSSVTESGKPLGQVPGIESVSMEKDAVIVTVVSGVYCFKSEGYSPA